jgi:Ni,Fe-hydrogenase I cytochrome b subunit
MFTWGLIVFIGLWLILRDVNPITRAKLMGSPMIIHVIVIGSGLAIHGGSADGGMAAIVSGVFSALYVRYNQRCYGFIRRGVWYPGIFRAIDPRGVCRA